MMDKNKITVIDIVSILEIVLLIAALLYLGLRH